MLLLSLMNMVLLCIGLFVLIDRRAHGLGAPLITILSPVIAFSLVSYFYYLSLVFHCPFYALLLFITVLNAIHLRRSIPFVRSRFANSGAVIGRVFRSWPFLFACLAVLLLSLYFIKYLSRWGGWDAWAIWNMHARFLFYPDSWKNLFSGKIAFTHADYPLMLPSLIAFLWRSWGAFAPIVPAVICYSVQIAVPLVCFFALYKQKAGIFSIAALLIFVIDQKYNQLASAQYADTLLALFILLAFVLYRHVRTASSDLLYLVGFIAAACTWIKNEGVLFYAAFTATFILCNIKRPRGLLQYFLGGLLPLLALASFKLFYAPASDLSYAGRMADVKRQLLDQDRYWIIIKALSTTVMEYYWIVVVLIVCNLLRRPFFFRSFAFIALAMVITGYFFVYVTTPNELVWHLESSSDRVMHHVYPAMVYLLLSRLGAVYVREKKTISPS